MKIAALATFLVASSTATTAPTSAPTYYRALPTAENAFIKSTYTDTVCGVENIATVTMGKKNLCAALSADGTMYDTTTTPGTITTNTYSDPQTCKTIKNEVSSYKMNECVLDGSGGSLRVTDYNSLDTDMIVVGVFSDYLCLASTVAPAYIMSASTKGQCDTVYNSGIPFSSFKATHTAPPNGVGSVNVYAGSSTTPNTMCTGTPILIEAASGFCTEITDATIVAALAGYGCAPGACFVEVFPVNALATAGAVTASVSALLLAGAALVGATLL